MLVRLTNKWKSYHTKTNFATSSPLKKGDDFLSYTQNQEAHNGKREHPHFEEGTKCLNCNKIEGFRQAKLNSVEWARSPQTTHSQIFFRQFQLVTRTLSFSSFSVTTSLSFTVAVREGSRLLWQWTKENPATLSVHDASSASCRPVTMLLNRAIAIFLLVRQQLVVWKSETTFCFSLVSLASQCSLDLRSIRLETKLVPSIKTSLSSKYFHIFFAIPSQAAVQSWSTSSSASCTSLLPLASCATFNFWRSYHRTLLATECSLFSFELKISKILPPSCSHASTCTSNWDLNLLDQIEALARQCQASYSHSRSGSACDVVSVTKCCRWSSRAWFASWDKRDNSSLCVSENRATASCSSCQTCICTL